MSNPDLRPTFVLCAARHSADGRLVAATHRRLRAGSLLEAEVLARTAYPAPHSVTVRPAERLDTQMWL